MDESGTMATVARVFNVVGFAGCPYRKGHPHTHTRLLRSLVDKLGVGATR
jgi:hypothetical protein